MPFQNSTLHSRTFETKDCILNAAASLSNRDLQLITIALGVRTIGTLIYKSIKPASCKFCEQFATALRRVLTSKESPSSRLESVSLFIIRHRHCCFATQRFAPNNVRRACSASGSRTRHSKREPTGDIASRARTRRIYRTVLKALSFSMRVKCEQMTTCLSGVEF